MMSGLGVAPTVMFFPEASFGAALNCVAIAQALARRGAVPVFICHPGFTGVFADYGFKEGHLPRAAQGDGRTVAYHWQDLIHRHLPHFDLSPLDQMPTHVGPTWEAIVDPAIAAEDGLARALGQIRPDAIVLDYVIRFSAVALAGCPWIRVISCAETEWPDARVASYLSGLTPDDATGRAVQMAAYLAATASAHGRYNAFRRAQGLGPLPAGQFVDPATTVYLKGFVRNEARFEVPVLPDSRGSLGYPSFGSLGLIVSGLIDRMIRVFATISARFIVNVGGGLDAYHHVPDNVFLGSWFPQPSVVEQSDLFIHHGGNNSFCEAMFFSVPSLFLPYCRDGHDNSVRAEMTGTGQSLLRSNWTDAVLRDRIVWLLAVQAMRARLAGWSAAIRANPGITQRPRRFWQRLQTRPSATGPPVRHS